MLSTQTFLTGHFVPILITFAVFSLTKAYEPADQYAKAIGHTFSLARALAAAERGLVTPGLMLYPTHQNVSEKPRMARLLYP
jgi:hypothetical protein